MRQPPAEEWILRGGTRVRGLGLDYRRGRDWYIRRPARIPIGLRIAAWLVEIEIRRR